MTFTDKFFFFTGKWHFNRSTNGYGNMHGIAMFSRINESPCSLFYHEEGSFSRPNNEITPFFRDYIYTLDQDHIRVFFARGSKKGDLFHTLNFTDTRTAHTQHQCGQDTYLGSYIFIDAQRFSLTYKVSGPKKDLVIKSHFERQVSP